MNSGGSGAWRSRGRREAMPKPVSQTWPVAELTSTLAGLMSLWMRPRSWRDAPQDRSGDTLADLVTSAGHRVATRKIVRDEQEIMLAQLKEWIADPEIDVVISTGGTGSPGGTSRPEAFHSVYEKEIAGFGELFRDVSVLRRDVPLPRG
jgi:hypothetical protein